MLGTNGFAVAVAYSDFVQGPLTGLDDSLHEESSVEALMLAENCINGEKKALSYENNEISVFLLIKSKLWLYFKERRRH